MSFFSGRVHTVIYEDAPQVFYILRMTLDAPPDGDNPFGFDNLQFDKPVSIRGHVPGLSVKIGTWFGFEGEWTTHPKYGRQIKIKKAPVIKGEWTSEIAVKMLTGHGVGQLLATRLHQEFGDDLIEALKNPKNLMKVPGVTRFSADHVVSRWTVIVAHHKVLDFLSDLKLPEYKISQIWSEFGDETEKTLSTNPWALVCIPGLSFPKLDEIARRVGLPMDDPHRVQGAVLYASKNQRDMGHLYQVSGAFVAGVQNYIPDVEKKLVAEALKTLNSEGKLTIDRTTKPGLTAIYDPWSYVAESESAAGLAARVQEASFHTGDDLREYIEKLSTVGTKTTALVKRRIKKLDPEKEKGWDKLLQAVAKKAIEEWGDLTNLQLAKDQFKGVLNALTNPVSIITGLPGTGKTTSLKVLVRVLQMTGVEFLLAAPTGIAAKRLESVTGAKASTLHRAFAAKGISNESREATYAGVVGKSKKQGGSDRSQEEWGYNASNPHPARFVVVDEASMVDQALLYRLLQCTSSDCRLVFVGDAAQLPSVGAGNVLRDLVKSELFPTVTLTEIFRQDDTSDIIYAAHEIHAGRPPKAEKGSDFTLLELNDEEMVLEAILKLAQRLYAKRSNFQIISPRHAGTVGVTNLNTRLRELLNPKMPGVTEHRLGGGLVREGDRVMVVKNHYKLGVFNGDVGKIERIDRKASHVEVKIHGPTPMLVRIPFKEAHKLIRMAYACTVHKAQGQEYDHIVMPLVPSFAHQLQRNLLYTGITRARMKVILLGSSASLAKAVANSREDSRHTLFVERLQREFEDN